MANEVGCLGVVEEGARGDGVAEEECGSAAHPTGFDASHGMWERVGGGETCGYGMAEDGAGKDGLGVSVGKEVDAAYRGAVGEWIKEEGVD